MPKLTLAFLAILTVYAFYGLYESYRGRSQKADSAGVTGSNPEPTTGSQQEGDMNPQKNHHEKMYQLLREAMRYPMDILKHHNFFNSMFSSIQHVISKGDKDLAMSYVAECNSLILKLERLSSQKCISLESEILIIKLYLKLATINKNGLLQWKIDVPPEMDLYDIGFPPMLVFPWVEFAVMCGNTVSVRFNKESNCLVVQVNGSLDDLMDLGWRFGGGTGAARKRLQVWNSHSLPVEPGWEDIVEGEQDTDFQVTIRIRQDH